MPAATSAAPAVAIAPPSTAGAGAATAADTKTATPQSGRTASPTATATGATSGTPGTPSEPPAAPASAADREFALQAGLEQQGKAYLQALQRGDAAAIQGMLAGRCSGADAAAIVAKRRAEISAQAGVPIEQITALNTLVAHFDAQAGEAHTLLQWVAAGKRMTLNSADGWLLEGGVWRNVMC